MTALPLPPPDLFDATPAWDPRSTLPPTDELDEPSQPSIEAVSGVWPHRTRTAREDQAEQALRALRASVRRPPRIVHTPAPRGLRRWWILVRATVLRAAAR